MTAWFLLFSVASARTITIGPSDDLWEAIGAAEPGDEIVVLAGTTWSTQKSSGTWLRQIALHGTAAKPIVVRGEAGVRPVLEGDPAGSQNIVNLSGEHFTWKGFEMRYGSHGLRLETSAHVVLEDLEIHHVGDVGLSMNKPTNTYEDITVRGVEIHDTAGDAGECMYLGCNSDGCRVFDSVIEWNWCHDTLAAGQGDGIELKTGSYGNIIRHNVIHDVKYPGITLYGTRGMAINEAYGNVIWNSGDNGIQTVGDAFVHDNLVFASGASGIASQPSQDETPKDLVITHNTVVAAGDACLHAIDWKSSLGADGIIVANNALFCADARAIALSNGRTATFSKNAVQGADEYGANNFAGDVDRDLTDGVGRDATLPAGSALVDAGDPAYVTAEDFDCQPRTGTPDVGAYDAAEPPPDAWRVVAGFKTCPTPQDTDVVDTDTDVVDTDPVVDTDSDPGPGGTDDPGCGCGAPGGAAFGAVGLLLPLFLRRRRRARG